jgi:acyl-CoA thioesterase-2
VPDHRTSSPDDGQVLTEAIEVALDGLLDALELDAIGQDRFRAVSEPARFDQVFGGQLLAQSLMAAGATVDGQHPHSVHAYFVAAGVPGDPLELAVARVREGRSISTRAVTVTQHDRTLLTALLSFHANPVVPDVGVGSPASVRPEALPRLQDWARRVTPERRDRARTWIERPPPLDLRIGEAPTFLGGEPSTSSRVHWMRVPRRVGDDSLLHAALLAYASDYFLLDMAFRAHPETYSSTKFTGVSLDHAIWIHRPVSFDAWHAHAQETLALVGHRSLVRGSIRDADGCLVASAMQEVLVRPRR